MKDDFLCGLGIWQLFSINGISITSAYYLKKEWLWLLFKSPFLTYVWKRERND